MTLGQICSIDGCDREVGDKGARGMCSMHYKRSRSGSVKSLARPVRPREPRPEVCTIPGCGKAVIARGWCSMHYMRWQTYGDPDVRGDPGGWSHRKADLMSLVEQGDGCWLWLGYKDKRGYGWRSGKPAHRLIYQLLVGPIPDGLVIDHICRNHSCVNPAHLRPLTRALNADANRIKTHCPQGHPYDEVNTHVDKGGRRMCRACNRERARRLTHASSSGRRSPTALPRV